MRHPNIIAAAILAVAALLCVGIWALSSRYAPCPRGGVVDGWTGRWHVIAEEPPPTGKAKKSAVELINEIEREPVAPFKP